MIRLTSQGSFKNTERFLSRMKKREIFAALHRHGEAGVIALQNATPTRTGVTANAWKYRIKKDHRSYSIVWENTHRESGAPIAILLQYGHGTGTGGYVQGIDYINPAIKPVFDRIAADVWKEVTSA